MTFHVPEKWRQTSGPMGSSKEDGNNGQFIIRSRKLKRVLFVQASDGEGWEHVSVSHRDRRIANIPTWDEMCVIKNIFWDPEDLVIQYHPPESKYINIHPNVLHLWRKAGTNEFCETPDLILV